MARTVFEARADESFFALANFHKSPETALLVEHEGSAAMFNGSQLCIWAERPGALGPLIRKLVSKHLGATACSVVYVAASRISQADVDAASAAGLSLQQLPGDVAEVGLMRMDSARFRATATPAPAVVHGKTMSISHLQLSDVAGAAPLFASFFATPSCRMPRIQTEMSLASATAGLTAAHESYMCGKLDDGSILGLVSWSEPYETPLGRHARIRLMFVPEALRGSGIAKPLLHAACAHLVDERGVDTVHLGLNPEYETAARLYTSFGFERVPVTCQTFAAEFVVSNDART